MWDFILGGLTGLALAGSAEEWELACRWAEG